MGCDGGLGHLGGCTATLAVTPQSGSDVGLLPSASRCAPTPSSSSRLWRLSPSTLRFCAVGVLGA